MLDTNVVVSAVLWGGKPGELVALAGEGDVLLHCNRLLLDELHATLRRPKLVRLVAAKEQIVEAIVADYRRLVTLTRRPLPSGNWSRDPDDDFVVACALAARADFLVTGDDDLLTLGEVGNVRIVTPSDLLRGLA